MSKFTLPNSSHWTSVGSTSYNTVYKFETQKHPPFSVKFDWEGKSVNVALKNGNDIFKLATAFMEWLDKNEIEYEVKTTGKKKKKK